MALRDGPQQVLDFRASLPPCAPDAPMDDEALKDEQGRGDKERHLSAAPADEASHRQDGREGDGQRERAKGRVMVRRQAAAERGAQTVTRRNRLKFGWRKGCDE